MSANGAHVQQSPPETLAERVRTDTAGSLEDADCHMDPYYQHKSLKADRAAIDAIEQIDVGESDSERESRVLVLYAGGTIGMKTVDGAYRPAPNYIMKTIRQMPMFNDQDYIVRMKRRLDDNGTSNAAPLAMPLSKEGRRVIYTIWEYDPLLDSCNMTMTDWARLALDIKKNYGHFDGFVILHGTDTMAYTASALSFMLENLGKPVVVTGSQIPIFEVRSDGRENFLGALIMAGHYCIPEVTIYFNNKLMRGNRASKLDAGAFDAFNSPNLSPLATLEIDITVNWDAVFRPTKLEAFDVHTNFCPRVGLLRLFPSITLATVQAFLQPPMEGVVLQTYGAGNGPDSRADLMEALEEACQRGLIIVNITQCSRGYVSPQYATGKALLDIGIVPGLDMTPEAALTKMSYVLGKSDWSVETKRQMMKTNVCGEMRVITSPARDVPGAEGGRQELLGFPLLQKLKDTMRLSSEDEVAMLKSALFPALLCSAARADNTDALRQLREAGAQFTQADYDGRTALHVASSEGKEDIVKYLLKNGALVHQRDRYGHSPIDDAVRFNHTPIIKLLRQVGGHLNVPPFKLGTLLCNAAALGNTQQLKSWHAAGADINQGDYDNRTALHVACCQGGLQLVKLLLEMGARAETKDTFNLTPLVEAEKRGREDVVNLLQNHTVSQNGKIQNPA